MASSIHVNSMCNSIHSLIQSSGLHYVINQTPWSSYITLRKKFIDPNHASAVEALVEPHSESQENPAEFAEVNRELDKKNEALKVALGKVKKEQYEAELRNKVTVGNLHDIVDNLEYALRVLKRRKQKLQF